MAKKKDTDVTAAQAHAEADAILAMHKIDKDDHKNTFRNFTIAFTILMIIIVGAAFVSTLYI